MTFDPELFLARYATAYGTRNPQTLRALFALDDPRFGVFEDFSEDLFDGERYEAVIEGVVDTTGEMSFDLLRCDQFGDFAVIHALQKIVDEDEDGSGTFFEACFRATLWVSTPVGEARIVCAHFSSLPEAGHGSCSR